LVDVGRSIARVRVVASVKADIVASLRQYLVGSLDPQTTGQAEGRKDSHPRKPYERKNLLVATGSDSLKS
jgi:hypothetical protein